MVNWDRPLPTVAVGHGHATPGEVAPDPWRTSAGTLTGRRNGLNTAHGGPYIVVNRPGLAARRHRGARRADRTEPATRRTTTPGEAHDDAGRVAAGAPARAPTRFRGAGRPRRRRGRRDRRGRAARRDRGALSRRRVRDRRDRR